MASDQIASLGLDVSEFEAGISTATSKISEAIRSANLLNTAIGLSAAAIAIWGKNFVDAKLHAEQMEKAIRDVSKSLSSSEFNTQSGLETRLKEVDDLLVKLQGRRPLSDIIFEKVGDLFSEKDPLGTENLEKIISSKVGAFLKDPIGALGGKDPLGTEDIEKSLFNSAKGIFSGLFSGKTDAKEDAAGTMAIEKRKEIEGQIAEKISAQTNVMRLQRSYGKDMVELEKIRLEYAEKRGAVTAANGRFSDSELKALKEQEKEAVQAVLDRQKKITEELQKQNEVTKLMRLGNSTAARKLQSENDFDRQIREAFKNGNGGLAEELEQQQKESRMAFAIEERNKSPEQKREENRAARKYRRDERNVNREDSELDDRIARGVTGSRGSRIERRREEVADASNRAQAVRKNISVLKQAGYGPTDSSNLQTIADAFTGGGGSKGGK